MKQGLVELGLDYKYLLKLMKMFDGNKDGMISIKEFL